MALIARLRLFWRVWRAHGRVAETLRRGHAQGVPRLITVVAAQSVCRAHGGHWPAADGRCAAGCEATYP